MCKVTYFTESSMFCVSVMLLAALALERYVVVLHPLKVRGIFSTRRMHVGQVRHSLDRLGRQVSQIGTK